MRCDRNDGAGHRLLEKQQSCRWIVRGVIPANLSSTRGEAASGDTRSQSNTHSIESEEVRYPWHPWYGRRVWIHEDLDKNGDGIRRCRSENDLNARPLELPAWMFDEERCRCMQICSVARVDWRALQRLKELLRQRKSQTDRDGIVESQHRLGGADAEASESLSTRADRSISSHGEEAGRARPAIGNSTKNVEAFGATVESTCKNDYLGAGDEEEEEEPLACAAIAAPAAAPAIAMMAIIFLWLLPCSTFICEILTVGDSAR